MGNDTNELDFFAQIWCVQLLLDFRSQINLFKNATIRLLNSIFTIKSHMNPPENGFHKKSTFDNSLLEITFNPT